MVKKNSSNKKYTYNEVLENCMHYFNSDELAATTWINKYALKDKEGNFLELTPATMHFRLANEFAKIEKHYQGKIKKNSLKFLSDYGKKKTFLSKKNIFEYLNNFKYIVPQGSVMSSLGNPYVIASLSNCVVLPEIFDSYGGILYTDQQMAQLYKRRCGVGVDISRLRPDGALITNSATSTTGAVSFMPRFSNTTREVAQNGRRGALMITMDIRHPDIEQFIKIKQDLTNITGANISVRINDDFMHAVERNEDFTLQFPIDGKEPLLRKKVNAKTIWNTIVKCAHNTAEPGILFWDTQHHYSTSSVYPEFKNESTNPCSEIAMQGGDSCRLIAINLFSFVDNPFEINARFDYKKFYEVVYDAQRLMDDLVDLEIIHLDNIIKKVNSDPEPNYIKDVELRTLKLLKQNALAGRRTGLGFTALADVCAALNIKFDSEDALQLIDKVMRIKCEAEFTCSIDLAITRGKFKSFNTTIEKKSLFVKMLEKEFPDIYKRMMKHGRRNISISTVAPTGTLSILTQTTSGIEPLYAISYKRRRKVNTNDKYANVDYVDAMGDTWQEFVVYHPKLKQWMDIHKTEDINKSPYHGATAPEINWEKRLEIQAIVQKYTTHSISSTINLPNQTSIEKVGEIYLNAWKKKLKGITVYRDGSRSGVLVAAKSTQTENNKIHFVERPVKIEASVIRFKNYDEQWIAFIGLINNKPYEIFTGKTSNTFHIPNYIKHGFIKQHINEKQEKSYNFVYTDENKKKHVLNDLSNCFHKEYGNYARLISGMLRHGMPLADTINLVESLHMDNEIINTWKNGVVRCLKQFVADGTRLNDKSCTNCGDKTGLIYEEGCIKCTNCGYSKCE